MLLPVNTQILSLDQQVLIKFLPDAKAIPAEQTKLQFGIFKDVCDGAVTDA
ncbi:hypothetical protein Hanom_Chr16g01428201 [Helianthus anomalus]